MYIDTTVPNKMKFCATVAYYNMHLEDQTKNINIR